MSFQVCVLKLLELLSQDASDKEIKRESRDIDEDEEEKEEEEMKKAISKKKKTKTRKVIRNINDFACLKF